MRFLHDLLPNQRLAVEVDMEHLCPMGDNGTYITKSITHLANDGHKLPLTIHDRKRMPSQLIENVVLEKKINNRWKDHKHHVKKAAYKKWNTVEERLANPPHNVVESQWRVLVEVWNTDLKKQAICQINKKNGEKQKFHHTTGSKPHAKCAAELGKKLGRRPKRHEVFGVTHTKKKKTEDPDEVLMDQEVAAELKEMEEVKIQARQPGSDIVLQGRHDVFSQVRGLDKGGRVRCLGNGINPKKYLGEESSTNPTTDPNAEVLNLRQQLENTVAQLQTAMQRIAELEALDAHHGLGIANTFTPSTDVETRNSPRMEDLGAHKCLTNILLIYNSGDSGVFFFNTREWDLFFFHAIRCVLIMSQTFHKHFGC
ncbi:hypothetical protein MKW98_021491 [Papaver atlanticum]|uniref:Transposase n=1 Tax=Papaver atlanticum TaxID=357466 RepID=A0AAD4SQA6_9MAGN|nr:hypothetical protein MKW98_021491 [Papaver atlanticum]